MHSLSIPRVAQPNVGAEPSVVHELECCVRCREIQCTRAVWIDSEIGVDVSNVSA